MDPFDVRVPTSMAVNDRPIDVQHLLERQLQIASALQTRIVEDAGSLSSKDLKDLSSTASSMIALSHKTEQLLKEVATLRLFSSVVMEFLRTRNDTLGEDILAELKRVADDMGAVVPD